MAGLARAFVVMVVSAALLSGSLAVALEVDRPADDAEASFRDLLLHSYRDRGTAPVRLATIFDDWSWDRMFALPPLVSRIEIRRMLSPKVASVAPSIDYVPVDHALLVFVTGSQVVKVVMVPRSPVDLGCLGHRASAHEAGSFERGDTVRIFPMANSYSRELAVTGGSAVVLSQCLSRLPLAT